MQCIAQDWSDVFMLGQLPRNNLSRPGRSLSRLRPALVLLGVLVCCVPSLVRAASFTATLDRDTVAVGESVTLSLKFEGGSPS